MTNRQAYSRNLTVPVDELIGVSTTLRRDIEGLLSAYRDDWSSQTLRRTMIRASWSMIEGVVLCVKRLTLRACELGSVNLPSDEHLFLSELQFVVDPAGEAKMETRRVDTLSNIKRSLKIASLRFDLPWKPVFGGTGWRNLADSLKIRHRLTHPKTAAECEVSEDELTLHLAGFEWFIQSSNEFQLALLKRYGRPSVQQGNEPDGRLRRPQVIAKPLCAP
jgi:hypothetical protein